MGPLPSIYMVGLPHFYHQSVGGRVSKILDTKNPYAFTDFSYSRRPPAAKSRRGTMSVAWEPIRAEYYHIL